MEEFGFKLKNRRFVWVLLGEVYAKSKCAAFPDGIKWAVDHCLPLVHVVLIRHSVNALIIALL